MCPAHKQNSISINMMYGPEGEAPVLAPSIGRVMEYPVIFDGAVERKDQDLSMLGTETSNLIPSYNDVGTENAVLM